ncbi:hypothetical protein L3Q65_10675 [Amycolatopsis sp. FU40]|uniref:hypothetical protein n=1 Tax=Amycolatopsis sp. FU40 TaxID=2914159 RepID=UPI001F18528E|nr:hypothetical protein [Amycolatopsis sp. FU40]UKD57160.1 hypothetical protein L3Q65_10675 [Amycolatopsis sp. FU40]
MDQLGWIAVAAGAAGLLLVGAARVAAAVRIRRHRTLIADALERMSALAREPAARPRLRSLCRDVAEVLARQDRIALALRAGEARAAGDPADLSVLITADAVTTTAEPMREHRPDDSAWEETDVAPLASTHPQLREISEQFGHSTTRLIALGRTVLGEGERLGLAETSTGKALAAALDQAQQAVRAAEGLADPLSALAALSVVEIPVPEAGFPGQAVADELRVQANALARLGIRHRTALSRHRDARIEKERR